MDNGFGLKMLDWIFHQRWLKYLLTKSIRGKIEQRKLTMLSFSYNDLMVEYYSSPHDINKFFSEDVCRLSFSGKKVPEITELDYFYLIKAGDEVVGFYRTINLYFDSIIELHGSYGYKDKSYLRSYLELSKIYILTTMKIFPKHMFLTLVENDNKATLHFVNWLGFYKIGNCKDFPSKQIFRIDNIS